MATIKSIQPCLSRAQPSSTFLSHTKTVLSHSFLALVLFFPPLLAPNLAQGQENSASHSQVRLHFVESLDCRHSILLDDTHLIVNYELLKKGSIVTNGVVLTALAPDGLTVRVESLEPTLQIQADKFSGSQLTIPRLQHATLRFNCEKALWSVSAGNEYPSALFFDFIDGGRAELPAGTSGTLEYFRDQSYVFSAQDQVRAWTAEGQLLDLSKAIPPLTGGPLVEMEDPETGQQRLHRVKPATKVLLNKDNHGTLQVTIGTESSHLEPGQRQTFTTSNGSSLDLSLNPNGHAVEWYSRKGYFQIAVSSPAGWSALGQTGKRASLLWNPATSQADVHNIDAQENLLIQLPNHTFAELDSATTLQFTLLNIFSFATAAAGGPVRLYNAQFDEVTELQTSNLTFVGGRLPQNENKDPSTIVNSFNIVWDEGAPVELNGSAGNASIAPDTERTLDFGDQAKLIVRYDEQGELHIVALQGHFEIRLAAVNGLTVFLPEGNSTSLTLDLTKRTFVIRTPTANRGVVRVTTAEGFAPELGAAQALNFNLGRDGALFITSSEGDLVFWEQAGSSPIIRAPTIGTPVEDRKRGSIDTSRIDVVISSPSSTN